MSNTKGIIFATLIFSTAIFTYLYGYSSYRLNSPLGKTAYVGGNPDVSSGMASYDVVQDVRTKLPEHHNESATVKKETQKISDLQKLSDEIRTKILDRQNPEDCDKARLLIYHVNWWPCGLGCTTHVTLQHFLLAFYTNRTFVLKSNGWGYSQKGWDQYFMPIGKCDFNGDINSLPAFSDEKSDARIVRSANKELCNKYDWKIPRNILSQLRNGHHGHPYAWWIGQFIKYMLRLQPRVVDVLNTKSKEVPFTNSTVGLQIRWGDKVGREASKHPVSEYMDLASKWLNRSDHQGCKTIYVATEESAAWKDLEDNYHNFSFIGAGFVNRNKELDYRKGANYAARKNELDAILEDLHFLSKCPYVVCTFSSNLCRLLFELAAFRNTNPQDIIKSLDVKFYYFMGYPIVQAIQDHSAEKNSDVIELKTGDEFQVSNESFKQSRSGYVLGKNTRTGETGRVPKHKLEFVVEPLDFVV